MVNIKNSSKDLIVKHTKPNLLLTYFEGVLQCLLKAILVSVGLELIEEWMKIGTKGSTKRVWGLEGFSSIKNCLLINYSL